ncbi:MAG: hypothetical protein M3O15_05350 [Acidobacteriota bacterium]|nr:hypothetical protein [Acidobacteriota bacterium]
MTADEPIRYTEDEVRSYLPTGWNLARKSGNSGGTEGSWDPGKKSWRITVIDNVDFDWPVVVKASEVDALEANGANGRIEALRRAMDKVYRERLG